MKGVEQRCQVAKAVDLSMKNLYRGFPWALTKTHETGYCQSWADIIIIITEITPVHTLSFKHIYCN